MSSQGRAILMASFVVLAWATVATAFKIALSGMSVPLLLFIATVVTLIISSLVLLRRRELSLALGSMRDPRRLGFSMLMGFLNPFIYYLILFKGYSLLPAQIAQPINFSWQIILIILMAIVFRERLRAITMVGVIVSFVGVILISLNNSASVDGALSAFGIALVAVSTFIWASYWVLNLKSKDEPVVGLFKNFLFGTVYMFIFIALFPETLSFEGRSILSGDTPDIKPLMAALYTGCFEMGITFILWGKALKLATNRTLLTQITYLAPVFSLFVIHFVLGESIGVYTIVGLFLIIFGLLIGNFRRSSHLSV